MPRKGLNREGLLDSPILFYIVHFWPEKQVQEFLKTGVHKIFSSPSNSTPALFHIFFMRPTHPFASLKFVAITFCSEILWRQKPFTGNHTLMPASISNHIKTTKPLPKRQYNKQWSYSTQCRPRSLACTSSWFLHDNCLNLWERSCPVAKERSQRTGVFN